MIRVLEKDFVQALQGLFKIDTHGLGFRVHVVFSRPLLVQRE